MGKNTGFSLNRLDAKMAHEPLSNKGCMEKMIAEFDP